MYIAGLNYLDYSQQMLELPYIGQKKQARVIVEKAIARLNGPNATMADKDAQQILKSIRESLSRDICRVMLHMITQDVAR